MIAIIFIVSLVLGFLKYGSLSGSYKTQELKDNWQIKFFEVWNSFFNFFMAGLVAYYFFIIRWPFLSAGEVLNASDFGLLVVFLLGVFGHLAVLSKNITEGINAILKRVLEGK